jgi:hypothetical protein
MELTVTLNINEDTLKAAIKADAESLSNTNELANLVFAKIEEHLDMGQVTNTYVNMLGEDTLRRIFEKWAATSNGRQVMLHLAEKAVVAQMDEIVEHAATTIASLYREEDLKRIAVNQFNGRSSLFEAALARVIAEKSASLDNLIVDTIQSKGAELIPKLVDSKLPGYISRAVKDILKAARIRFYQENQDES